MTNINSDNINTTKTEVGTLWWHFDNKTEAESWIAENKERGVSNIRIQNRPDSSIVEVIFDIEKDRVQDVLGYEPEEDEWLIEESLNV